MFAKNRHQFAVLGYVGAAALFSTSVSAQNADATASEPPGEEIEEVVVTGFRASLQNSVGAKRDNIAFTDSIYAEDIGKFPDLNLAESLQRIPGVQIARDFTGEGTSVAVRGLGKDFTQITLNGVARRNRLGQQHRQREPGTRNRPRAVPDGAVPPVDGEQDAGRQSDRRRGSREHRPAHCAPVR